MAVKQIKIEDLVFEIPPAIDSRFSKATRRTIGGGLLSESKRFNRGSVNFQVLGLSASEAGQLREMVRNYAFNSTVLSGISDIWDCRLVIDTIRGDHLWYDRAVQISGTIQLEPLWNFVCKSMERTLHDRWKYLIQEDFDDSHGWPDNAAITTDISSTGYGNQVQTMIWEEADGSWNTSDTVYIIASADPQSIESMTHNSWDYMRTGWDWWENYIVETWVYCDETTFASDYFGLIFRASENTSDFNGYRYIIVSDNDKVQLAYWDTGAITYIKENFTWTITEKTWYHLKVVVEGHRIRCYFNGALAFDVINTLFTSGKVGCVAYGQNTHFDDFRVTLLPPTNFNLPASVDWTNQYSHADIATAYGTQKKIISPVGEVEFKQSKAGGDCVLWLPMNEGQGTPKDHSKENHAVINYGGDWIDDDEKGWCMKFDEVDGEYLAVNIDGLLDASTEVTVDFDIYLPAGSNGYFASLWRSATDRFMWYGDGKVTFYNDINNSNEAVYNPDNDSMENVWYRCTTIISSNGIFAFVDGALVGFSATTGLTIADILPDYLLLASAEYPGVNNGDCRICNLRLFDTGRWDVALGHDSTPATLFCWDNYHADRPDDSDCVGLWHFDEGSGTICYDASGKGHDITLRNGLPFYDTSFRGEAGTCLDFEDDSGHTADAPDHSDFSFAGDVPFSVECWIKPESLYYNTLICKGSTSLDTSEWILHTADSKIAFTLSNPDRTASIRRYYSTALSVDKWYHVVGTYDGSETVTGLKVYLNGIQVDDASHTVGTYAGMTAGAGLLFFGTNDFGSRYDGPMDEPRIHRKELSAEEVAARYRSEPYLHDFYQMTRVYHKSHPWKGLPVISNGLVMLNFPDYDSYQERHQNILFPTMYAWYENSWHLIGMLDMKYRIGGSEQLLSNYADATEWEIVELTDQYCKLRIRYYIVDQTNLPEGIEFDVFYTIRNGYPGIFYEIEEKEFIKTEYTCLKLSTKFDVGAGLTYRFWYGPEDHLFDIDIEAGGNEWVSELDDNWAIMFNDPDSSNAPSKNVIVGLCGNSKYTDLGSAINRWLATSSDNTWWNEITAFAQQAGSIFFVPYDVDLLFVEAEDEQALGHHSGATISDQGDDSGTSVLLDALNEYVYWEIGALDTGAHNAVARLKCGTNGETATVEIRHTAHDGTLVTTEDVVLTTTYTNYYVPFHVSAADAGKTFFCKVIYSDSPVNEVTQTKTVATSEVGWAAGSALTYNDNICRSKDGTPGETLYVYNYGFDWAGAVDINGIEVTYHRGNESGGVASYSSVINLCTSTTERATSKADTMPDAITCTACLSQVKGHATDLWGMSQANANLYVKDINFGVSYRNTTTIGGELLWQDGYQIKVWYDKYDLTGIYVDYFVCVPLSNDVNYPSDLAHMAFSDCKVVRA